MVKFLTFRWDSPFETMSPSNQNMYETNIYSKLNYYKAEMDIKIQNTNPIPFALNGLPPKQTCIWLKSSRLRKCLLRFQMKKQQLIQNKVLNYKIIMRGALSYTNI